MPATRGERPTVSCEPQAARARDQTSLLHLLLLLHFGRLILHTREFLDWKTERQVQQFRASISRTTKSPAASARCQFASLTREVAAAAARAVGRPGERAQSSCRHNDNAHKHEQRSPRKIAPPLPRMLNSPPPTGASLIGHAARNDNGFAAAAAESDGNNSDQERGEASFISLALALALFSSHFLRLANSLARLLFGQRFFPDRLKFNYRLSSLHDSPLAATRLAAADGRATEQRGSLEPRRINGRVAAPSAAE